MYTNNLSSPLIENTNSDLHNFEPYNENDYNKDESEDEDEYDSLIEDLIDGCINDEKERKKSKKKKTEGGGSAAYFKKKNFFKGLRNKKK